MNIKKGISNDENLVEAPNDNVVEEPKIVHYSVIAEYDGLILDKEDMKNIYSELKKVKANINRRNMDKTKSILTSKLNLELPISRRDQLEHLTFPYTKDQITSQQKDDQMKQNLIILQYYIDIICYGYSIYLTKWQCSSWFNIFKATHEKFIDYVKKQNDPSTYRSECINIFKNELFYFCNPRTVTLYLKEDESDKNNTDGGDDSRLNNDDFEEYLLSNRYVKPGIFDSILPPRPDTSDNEKNIEFLSGKSQHSINDQTITTSDNVLNNKIKNNNDNDDGSNINIKSNEKLDENPNDNKNNINNNNEVDKYHDNEYGEKENEDNDTQNKEFYIYQYNIPRTFNSLQIESLTRFFIKTYVQHIYIIAYVFSNPQEYIYHHFRRKVTLPVPFEELEHGIVAEEWPNWVEEQENILIRKKEEEEIALENERKMKEEMLLKEKERLEEELAQQKLKETQDNIKNSLNSLLYQPYNKTIGGLPEIPLVKSLEENNEQNNEDNNYEKITINNENEEEQQKEALDENSADVNSIKFKISNPNFGDSFLDLWKKQETVKEQKRKDLVYQLKHDYQRKNDRYAFDISEQSLVNFERSRNNLINRIKEVTGEDITEIIRHVYDPEKVESIIQNSEFLKEQYFTLIQKHVEEMISSNVQHILERLDVVNSELEKLRESVIGKNNPPNKKGANKDDKKNDKNNKPQSKKETSKSKSKPKKK